MVHKFTIEEVQTVLEPGSLTWEFFQQHVRVFDITALPVSAQEHPESYLFTVTVEKRGKNAWVVKSPSGQVYSKTGEKYGHEPLPSSRTKEFINDTRMDLTEAIQVAFKVAPTLTVNGVTVEQFAKNPR